MKRNPRKRNPTGKRPIRRDPRKKELRNKVRRRLTRMISLREMASPYAFSRGRRDSVMGILV